MRRGCRPPGARGRLVGGGGGGGIGGDELASVAAVPAPAGELEPSELKRLREVVVGGSRGGAQTTRGSSSCPARWRWGRRRSRTVGESSSVASRRSAGRRRKWKRIRIPI